MSESSSPHSTRNMDQDFKSRLAGIGPGFPAARRYRGAAFGTRFLAASTDCMMRSARVNPQVVAEAECCIPIGGIEPTRSAASARLARGFH